MQLLEDIGTEYYMIEIIDLIRVINQKEKHEKRN